jgi:hypothetical protein
VGTPRIPIRITRVLRMLPDGYSDKLSHIADKVSDLNPADTPAMFCEARQSIIADLWKLSRESSQ